MNEHEAYHALTMEGMTEELDIHANVIDHNSTSLNTLMNLVHQHVTLLKQMSDVIKGLGARIRLLERSNGTDPSDDTAMLEALAVLKNAAATAMLVIDTAAKAAASQVRKDAKDAAQSVLLDAKSVRRHLADLDPETEEA